MNYNNKMMRAYVSKLLAYRFCRRCKYVNYTIGYNLDSVGAINNEEGD
jgi:hypothetical protein